MNLYGYCTQATGVEGKIEMHAIFKTYSTVFVTWLGKPNIISVWAENSVSLVTKARTGTIVIDKTAPIASPAFIQVCVSVLNM